MPSSIRVAETSSGSLMRSETTRSPYEFCIHAITGELQRLEALLVELRIEDGKINENCGAGATRGCGKSVSFEDERHIHPAHDDWEPRSTFAITEKPSILGTNEAPSTLECNEPLNSALNADDTMMVRGSGGSVRYNSGPDRGPPRQTSPSDNAVSVRLSTSDVPASIPTSSYAGSDFRLQPSVMSTVNYHVMSSANFDEWKRQEALRTGSNDSLPMVSDMHSTLRKKIHDVVASYAFELAFSVALVSYSGFIGIEVEWRARNSHEEEITSFVIINFFYGGVFALELILRMCAHGIDFFKWSHDVFWNYLDLIIVGFSLYELLLYAIINFIGGFDRGGAITTNMWAARLLRGARLMRLVRIARITRFVEALRTLVLSILGTLRSLFWSMLLLTLLIYTFAIAFTQAAIDYMGLDSLPDEEMESLQHYWGNLLRAMLTLFASLSGGVSWEGPAWIISQAGTHMLILYIVFMIFTYMAVMNVVAAVFVQSANETALTDHDMIIKRKIAQKKAYIELARKLFCLVDKNSSGRINLNELQNAFDDEQVQAYFESLEIRVDRAWSLFKLFDADEGSSIDVHEFETGCLGLRGEARGLDLASMRAEIRFFESQLCDHMTWIENTLRKVVDHVFGPGGNVTSPPFLQLFDL